MVNHERVADNVYSFQSTTYAQVTAGVVSGPNWAVVIDTLAFPEESLTIRDFVEQELKVPVRYVIDTHYHADHSWGNSLFTGALVIASSLCRTLLDEKGRPSLAQARKQNPLVFRNLEILLPHLTFEQGELGLRVGKKTLKLFSLPGHSADGIGVLIEEDRVLFAGDVFMPVPYIVDGDLEQMVASLKKIARLGLENIVQGHGDVILRGEIDGTIRDNIAYLNAIRNVVKKAADHRFPLDVLERADIASCGKSRVLIGGLADELHRRNLIALYRQMFGKLPLGSEEYDDSYGDIEDGEPYVDEEGFIVEEYGAQKIIKFDSDDDIDDLEPEDIEPDDFDFDDDFEEEDLSPEDFSLDDN